MNTTLSITDLHYLLNPGGKASVSNTCISGGVLSLRDGSTSLKEFMGAVNLP